MRGTLEVFDPLSLSNQVRAALGGPGLYLGMAEYALRNVPFVAGYALDIMRLPREWMPYNRIVLQLHPQDVEVEDIRPFPPAQAARVPGVPAEVSRRLAGVPRGYACWFEGGVPVIRPALWEVERGSVMLAATDGHPRAGTPGALVVESHHSFRPSLMVGACVRGTFGGGADRSAIAERYALDQSAVPAAFELRPERVGVESRDDRIRRVRHPAPTHLRRELEDRAPELTRSERLVSGEGIAPGRLGQSLEAVESIKDSAGLPARRAN